MRPIKRTPPLPPVARKRFVSTYANRSGIKRRASLGLLSLIAAVGCNDPQRVVAVGGEQVRSLEVLRRGAANTYKIGSYSWSLWIDSSLLVVQSRDALFESTVARRAVLSGAGAVAVTPLVRGDGLWRVNLGSSSDVGRRSLRRVLESDSLVSFLAPVYRDSSGEEVLPLARLMVRFKTGTLGSRRRFIADSVGLRLLVAADSSRSRFEELYAYPAGIRDPFALAEQVALVPEVVFAEPDRSSGLRLHYVPSDPFYSLQFYLKNSVSMNAAPVDIAIQRVWDFTTGSSSAGVRVAVLDDGIQAGHPDFAANTVAGGLDAAGDCAACPADPQPLGNGFSHGTAVAGIIGARHNNGQGIAGIAPSVTLVPVRIRNNNDVTPSVSTLVYAINWSWQLAGVDVINASWDCCGGGSPSLDSAIARAVTQGRSGFGTVVVFSAGNLPTSERLGGNPGGVKYPAANPNVISVSAIDRYGAPAPYAPRGKVDLVAPSSAALASCVGDVVSLDRIGAPGCNDGPNGSSDYTSTFGGTSAAAPQVAGVAALLLAREPSLTVAQVRQRLAAGADPWGRSDDFGAGKLNATFSVFPFVLSVAGPTNITSPGGYTWSANAAGGDGIYFYSWAYQNWGQSNWIGVNGGSTVTRTIDATTNRFRWRVTVFSANRTIVRYIDVAVEVNGCSPFCE